MEWEIIFASVAAAFVLTSKWWVPPVCLKIRKAIQSNEFELGEMYAGEDADYLTSYHLGIKSIKTPRTPSYEEGD